jgi:hypothetical protein
MMSHQHKGGIIMPYQRTNWVNGESGGTPLDADNLNHMEDGIVANEEAIEEVSGTVDDLSTEVEGKQDALTFDDVPTKNSNNPVKSNGIYDAILNVLPTDSASGNPCVITDAFGSACKSLKLTLEPIQSGSGTPSPSNVRPISGFTEADLTVADAETNPTQTHTYTINLDGTRYGGSVDFKTGAMSISHLLVVYDGSNDESWVMFGSGSASAYAVIGTLPNTAVKDGTTNTILLADYLESIRQSDTWGNHDNFISQSAGLDGSRFVIGLKGISTSAEALKTFLAEHPLAICYKLATPITVQLTPEEVTLLRLNNVLTTNGSSISVSYSADVQAYIDKKVAEGSASRSVDTLSLTKSGSSESTEETKEEITEEK